MNYDYKIVNVDPSLAFMKRVALYLAILSAIVALALVILFVLFERYLMLLMPGGMFLFSAVIWFLIGRSPASFSYSFSSEWLEVEANSATVLKIALSDLRNYKNAEKSDFINKNIQKYAFINSRIVLKNALNDNTVSLQFRIVEKGDKCYLFAFDNYALTLLGGTENEV